MKQRTFRVVLILGLAMIAGFVPYATDSAYSWGREGPMLEGVSQAQIDSYRFGGYGYQGAGYCGPMYSAPPVFDGGIGAGPPPVRKSRPHPRRGAPALGNCE